MIWIEQVPDTPEWAGIRDRVRRRGEREVISADRKRRTHFQQIGTMSIAKETALRGRALVAEALRARGLEAVQVMDGRRPFLEIRNPATGARVHLSVRAKSTRDWQTTSLYGDDPTLRSPETFWIFVEEKGTAADPEFFVVPEKWIKDNIFSVHQQYLGAHGGRRPQNDASLHHRIERPRIERWRSRWDLLGI